MEISIPALDWLVIAPELVILVTALLVMMIDLVLSQEQKSRLAWLSLVGVVAAAGVSYYIWDGSNPVLKDMLAADGYALFLNLVILSGAALSLLFSIDYARRSRLAQGEYYTLLLLSTLGMMVMAAAINLMTIFLALEILSIALYILVGLNRAEPRAGEAAVKYLLLGAFASSFLLYGMALTYGQAGTTSLAGIQNLAKNVAANPPALLLVGMGLMIVGLGFKVALVPFHMWTPDAYQGAPTSVTAFMSIGAKAAGFAALGRVLLYALAPLQADWVWVLAILSALTMTLGNLAALRQTNLKRMLAYSSIAHAGYMVVGLAAGAGLGSSAVLFYLFIYAFMNVGAFAVIIAAGHLIAGPQGGFGGAAQAQPRAGPGHGRLYALAGRSASPGRLSGQALCLYGCRPGPPDLAGHHWSHQQRHFGLLLSAGRGSHVWSRRKNRRNDSLVSRSGPADRHRAGRSRHATPGPVAHAHPEPGPRHGHGTAGGINSRRITLYSKGAGLTMASLFLFQGYRRAARRMLSCVPPASELFLHLIHLPGGQILRDGVFVDARLAIDHRLRRGRIRLKGFSQYAAIQLTGHGYPHGVQDGRRQIQDAGTGKPGAGFDPRTGQDQHTIGPVVARQADD
jgi:NADH-quinone oxidoreductase subunit N